MPMPMAKNACPTAEVTASKENVLISGLNMYVSPFDAPSTLSPITMHTIMMTANAGSRNLFTFSTPFCTPPLMMTAMITQLTTAKRNMVLGSLVSASKESAMPAASIPEKKPVAVLQI